MTKPTRKYEHGISLCMLAHQMKAVPFGEEGLVKFLENCSPNVEEINLIDTSEDGDIGDKLKGNIADNVKIYRTPHSVNVSDFDFSAHRNFSILMANYSWILVLDPDERIENWKAVRDVVNNPIENKTYGQYSFIGCDRLFSDDEKELIREKYDFTTGMARLFRNNRKIFQFENRVYECLQSRGGDLDVLFCGYVHSFTAKKVIKSTEFYIAITESSPFGIW